MSTETNFKRTTALVKHGNDIACMAESMSKINDYLYQNQKEMDPYMQVQPLRLIAYEAKGFHIDKIPAFHLNGDDWQHLKGDMYGALDIHRFDEACKHLCETTSKTELCFKPESRDHITIKLNPLEIRVTIPNDKYSYYDYKFYIAHNYNIPLVVNTGDPKVGCKPSNFIDCSIIFQGVLNAVHYRIHPVLAKHDKISNKITDKSCLVEGDWNELTHQIWNKQWGNEYNMPESFQESFY